MHQEDLHRRHDRDRDEHPPQPEQDAAHEERQDHGEGVQAEVPRRRVRADQSVVDLLHDREHDRSAERELPPRMERDELAARRARRGERDEHGRDRADEGPDERHEVEQAGDESDHRPVGKADQVEASHRRHPHEERHQQLPAEVPAERRVDLGAE